MTREASEEEVPPPTRPPIPETPEASAPTLKPPIGGSLLMFAGILTIFISTILFLSAIFIHIPGLEENKSGTVIGSVYFIEEENVTFTNITVKFANITVKGTELFNKSLADGSFTLEGVPAGIQTLVFSSPGYKNFSYEIIVFADEVNAPDVLVPEDLVLNTPLKVEMQELKKGEDPELDGIEISDAPPPGLAFYRTCIPVCSVLAIAFSMISMIAGYFAIKRRNYRFTAIGAILGGGASLWSVNMLFPPIFCLIGFLLIYMGRAEFSDVKKVKTGGEEDIDD